jgi:hypothetical protein
MNSTQIPPTRAVDSSLSPDQGSLVYFDHGYEAGYRQAVSDLLAALQPLSESFLAGQGARAEEWRKMLYPFEAYLEKRIASMGPDHDFVEDGLGI